MKFLLPTGIGDSVWALHKIKSVRDAHAPGAPIDIYLSGADGGIDSRAKDFVRRFSFVNSVQMKIIQLLGDPLITPEGYYNYMPDGLYNIAGEKLCALIPNAPLERGIRLEDWLPHHSIDWDIFSSFRISDDERWFGDALQSRLGDYAVFYPGPLNGNTVNGHNRNMIWKPADWISLGKRIHDELGLRIVVVGAPYDAAYFDAFLEPVLNGSSGYWTNLIGQTNIGQLYATTSNAKFVVSYQAGVGIIATYLKTPTAIFWRARGDSISPNEFLSFEESMASSWVPPSVIADGNHLPLIYGKHDVGYIMEAAKSRGWAK